MIIKDLIKVANSLDEKGFRKEADYLDDIIIKIATGVDLIGGLILSGEIYSQNNPELFIKQVAGLNNHTYRSIARGLQQAVFEATHRNIKSIKVTALENNHAALKVTLAPAKGDAAPNVDANTILSLVAERLKQSLDLNDIALDRTKSTSSESDPRPANLRKMLMAVGAWDRSKIGSSIMRALASSGVLVIPDRTFANRQTDLSRISGAGIFYVEVSISQGRRNQINETFNINGQESVTCEDTGQADDSCASSIVTKIKSMMSLA